ncbi:hypothetical protein VIGAN_06072800 [Vigna angularis var. angularis]|uniref:Uncharacterized protein n=1 Tax=Vigna angularis var. angularis TaxID=157739 RepID=A0A0S3SA74_PHAAN|nr:hypothetical protein VIGAN_06072800 [Vigna angularis var. angularis]
MKRHTRGRGRLGVWTLVLVTELTATHTLWVFGLELLAVFVFVGETLLSWLEFSAEHQIGWRARSRVDVTAAGREEFWLSFDELGTQQRMEFNFNRFCVSYS